MAPKVVSPVADVKGLKLAFLGGTGRMGYALARLHAKSGFRHVAIGSRDPGRAKEAASKLRTELQLPPAAPGPQPPVSISSGSLSQVAAEADVVFWVAGPTGSACKTPEDLRPRFQVLGSLRQELQGKHIVDCTNVMYAYPDSAWGSTSSLLLSQEALGAPARWTCAWKSVFFKRALGEPAPEPSNPMSVFVCGDDEEAKGTTIQIVDQIPGFKGLDAGSANHSRILELLGPKWLQELETWNYTDRGYVAGWRYGP